MHRHCTGQVTDHAFERQANAFELCDGGHQ